MRRASGSRLRWTAVLLVAPWALAACRSEAPKTTERGLLLITAWAGGPDAAELHADALAQATGTIESLEFIELG